MTRLSAERFHMQQRIKEGQRAQRRADAQTAVQHKDTPPAIVCSKCGSADVKVCEPDLCGPCYIAECNADD